jgi:hypothetical protein
MDSVGIREFSFSILPVIIAAGHLGLDWSGRPGERRLEIFLLYLLGVGVAEFEMRSPDEPEPPKRAIKPS